MANKKGKFLSKDLNELLNESQFFKNSPKPKKTQKRQNGDSGDNGGNSAKVLGDYQTKKKKQKTDEDVEQSRQKLLKVMEHQMDARKQVSESLLHRFSNILAKQEVNSATLTEHGKKLEHVFGVVLKSVQQSSASVKSNLDALKESTKTFKKEFEELEASLKVQTEKLADQLEEDLEQLQQKLVSEVKRKQMDSLRKSIFDAMQNDL